MSKIKEFTERVYYEALVMERIRKVFELKDLIFLDEDVEVRYGCAIAFFNAIESLLVLMSNIMDDRFRKLIEKKDKSFKIKTNKLYNDYFSDNDSVYSKRKIEAYKNDLINLLIDHGDDVLGEIIKFLDSKGLLLTRDTVTLALKRR